ncbi:MAG: 50S ribosomal protein L21 [Lentisphaeria bacterium]|nr:50S ribosomal protein L21 [Lentisphaeria bacterium]
MYAIVSLQGQQFKVEPGTVIDVNRMAADEGAKVVMEDSVLMAKNEDGLQTGTPILSGAKIELEVLEHYRAKKITVFKMKRRKRYRRKQGHRQDMTKVKVTDISLA